MLVPPAPGLCSAFGALAAGVRIDAVRSVHLTDVSTTAAEVAAVFAELEQQARADFAAQGVGEEPVVRRLAAMRYQGQNYEQEVPFPSGELDDDALRDAYERYGGLYQEFYGYRLDGIPIELVRLAVIATGETPSFPRLPGGARGGRRPFGDERRVLPRRAESSTRGSCAGRRSGREPSWPGPRSSSSWTRRSSSRPAGRSRPVRTEFSR